MIRSIFGALLLAGSALQPAVAHMVWLERDGQTLQLYFGEPAENLRERTGATLDNIASPRLLSATGGITRQPDHVAFNPVPPGDTRVAEEGLTPRDDRQRGGRTRTVFLAREGRAETVAGLALELVPTSPGGATFRLLFRGQPLPQTAVELIGPPLWSKSLRTDAAGQVTLPLPWVGRYIAEVQHVVEEPGGADPGAYNRARYVSTLSFVADSGIAWTQGR